MLVSRAVRQCEQVKATCLKSSWLSPFPLISCHTEFWIGFPCSSSGASSWRSSASPSCYLAPEFLPVPSSWCLGLIFLNLPAGELHPAASVAQRLPFPAGALHVQCKHTSSETHPVPVSISSLVLVVKDVLAQSRECCKEQNCSFPSLPNSSGRGFTRKPFAATCPASQPRTPQGPAPAAPMSKLCIPQAGAAGSTPPTARVGDPLPAAISMAADA